MKLNKVTANKTMIDVKPSWTFKRRARWHQQILETKEKIEVLTENLGQVAVAGNEGPNLRE